MKKNTTYEVCPHCNVEVELNAELMVQTCPHCGKRIVTCSMCRACDSPEPYCKHCCLCHQARLENEELGRLPIDEIEAIYDLLVRANVEEVSFLNHRNKPTFTKDGIKYEIVAVNLIEYEPVVELDVIPSYDFKLVSILLETSWRKATLVRIKKAVEDYLYKQGLL